MAYRVGFIGAGSMGGALLERMTKGDETIKFAAYDVNSKCLDQLSEFINFDIESSAVSLVENSDIIILAVKPQYCKEVLFDIKESFNENKILVSVIVGLPISFYKNILGDKVKVVRTMPNTPALVGEGMTLVSFDDLIENKEKELILKLFSHVGKIEELNENLMCEVTALTGSSPAYVFMFIEAMADAAVQSGIPRQLAYKLASQAVLGSAKMVLDTGRHPAELKDMVCSPAGTTIEAVVALEREGFRNAVITAMNECTRRAKEIADGI
ncbi:MAG: pyrroline-5-carboxylate reductase [Clostridiaceae bacterium]|nr:pyrroline-5-carboxylate reductase [Clostridiaceae bacterium]